MFLSIVVAGLLSLAAPPQVPTRVSVEWSAPPACPDAPTVHRWVEALSGAEVGSLDESETHAVGVVTAVTDGFALELAVEGPAASSMRHLEAADCNTLGRAAAVVIGVALDPIAVVVRTQPIQTARPAEPKAMPPPEPPPPLEAMPEAAKPESKSEPAPTPELADTRARPARTSSLEYGGRLGVGAAGRVLPGAGLATEVSGFVGVSRVQGRAVFQFRPERDRQLSGNTDAGAGFRLTAGGVRLCPQLLPARRLRVPLCAGADAGAVRGSGFGDALSSSRQVRSFWAAVAVQPGLEIGVVPWLSVFVDAELAISLSRPRFFLDNGGALHETARIAPRGMLGVQFHRPRVFP